MFQIFFAAYIQATAALLVIAGLLTVLASGFTISGLRTDNANRKYLFYRVAMYIALVTGIVKEITVFSYIFIFVLVLLELISLVVFPVCFYLQLKNLSLPSWDFDWSVSTLKYLTYLQYLLS